MPLTSQELSEEEQLCAFLQQMFKVLETGLEVVKAIGGPSQETKGLIEDLDKGLADLKPNFLAWEERIERERNIDPAYLRPLKDNS